MNLYFRSSISKKTLFNKTKDEILKIFRDRKSNEDFEDSLNKLKVVFLNNRLKKYE